jgi:hypothetical protein
MRKPVLYVRRINLNAYSFYQNNYTIIITSHFNPNHQAMVDGYREGMVFIKKLAS